MPFPGSGVIVDLLGFLTGAVLYAMLVVMVWRERAGDGTPVWSRLGRLPLLTGVFGLIWNIGALASFGMQVAASSAPTPVAVAVAFGALGFLPAAVVHSLLEGRETATGRALIRPAIFAAYGLSTTALVLHVSGALRGGPVPSRPALWLLTVGFTVVTVSLLVVTRQQPIGRRGIWVAALAIFAVSALHFGRHVGNESWWVELLGHHASLPLALAILHQDYRFALADLFLKHAIALLLLVGLSFGVFSLLMAPALRSQDSAGVWDPRAVVLVMVMWIGTALTYPLLRRAAAWVVDRAVLRRPDYDDVLAQLSVEVEAAEGEPMVVERTAEAIRIALGVLSVSAVPDPMSASDTRVTITAPVQKGIAVDAGSIALLRLRTVELPHPALVLGPLAAGRRLLSDDLHWLHAVSRLAARRIDAQRVAQERLARNLREEAMERMATEAELRALRAQLHPHFLFNALTTIGYLIQHAPPRALQMLLQLTSVLRGVLRRSTSEFSTLREEIDLVTSYLDIEHARFEERLRVTIDVPADLGGLAIPTLLLQPLVENAVRHGVSPHVSGGRITVIARSQDGRLRIVVEDSGLGFDPSTIARSTGVGLRSVGERLRAHYGSTAALDVRSASGMGTTITVELPARVIAAPRDVSETQPDRRAG